MSDIQKCPTRGLKQLGARQKRCSRSRSVSRSEICRVAAWHCSVPAALHSLKEGCEASTHPPSTVHHRHGPEVPAK